MLNQIADDLLFVLENDSAPAKRVHGAHVLQAVNERLSDRLHHGPEGSTRADAWIARYGDPMANTEAAMRFVRTVLGVPVQAPVTLVASEGYSSARIDKEPSVTVCGAFPIALCAAGLAHYLRKNG